MCYSGSDKRLSTLPAYSPVLLGFNEPDHANQANMTVDDAYAKWSILVGKSDIIASPAMAGNPAASGSWLEIFAAKVPAPKMDYVAVHWYGGIYASSFKKRMTEIYNKFGKKLWITEFACQTYSSAKA
jgi:O-glycosyl hydrolase